jgi:hypothetical protein
LSPDNPRVGDLSASIPPNTFIRALEGKQLVDLPVSSLKLSTISTALPHIMSTAPAAGSPYFSKQFIEGVYIPSGLLVFGCAITKKEWLPYAIALALVLGGYKIYSSRKIS